MNTQLVSGIPLIDRMNTPLVTGIPLVDRMNVPLAFIILVIGIVLAAVVLAVFAYLRHSRANVPRDHVGDLRNAEESQKPREQEEGLARRKIGVIRALSVAEKNRFGEAWTKTQARFFDSPRGAVSSADDLLGEMMRAKGYPVNDFEQKAAGLSADHPVVVQEYRAAHAAALRPNGPDVGTEELRRAMVHYRTLFDALANNASESRAAG